MELTEGYYIFLTSSVIACVLGCGRMIYKSKCKNFSFCGITVERDVAGEERLDNIQLQRANSQAEQNV